MDARNADLDVQNGAAPTRGAWAGPRMDLQTRILFLHRAGQGPGEIAKTLGVSRMTVWRKLKGAGPAQDAERP